MTLALGLPSVAYAQTQISSREFAEWLAYDRIAPLGPERADWRAALIAATVANAFRGRARRAYKVEDFMPRFDGGAAARRDGEELEVMMSQWASMYQAAQRGEGDGDRR